MKSFILILFLFIPVQFNQLFAQELGDFRLFTDYRTLQDRMINEEINYAAIEGSPYFSDYYIDGTVYLTDGKEANLSLRYDMYLDEMEFTNKDKILWVNKKNVKFIKYGTNMFFVGLATDDTSKLQYYILKDTGEYTLYIKKKAVFYPSVAPKGYSAPVPDRFELEKDEFYIKLKDKPAQKIKNKKALLSLLANDKAALDYIKEKKLRADDIEDLHKLVLYLNSQ
jgi:hypothetical protein